MTASRADRPTWLFLAAALALLALRIALLRASTLELQFDEAQYWFWSRSPDWGYFSKPPLIAWAIAATTALFGDAEWAVRLSAPIMQTLAAGALFALGRSLYGPWAGFWAGLSWLLMPAVWVSSSVMSTDALLMPLWAFALFSLHRLIKTRSWRWALALGLSIGLGALAKYAMLYFLGCAALAALFSPTIRRVLLSPQGAAILAVAALVLTPNIAWNAAHAFATVAHTAANAGGSGFAFHPEELAEFLGAQALVLGPVLFFALIALLVARFRSHWTEEDVFLLSFTAPPLAVIAVQALLSHAHANWAVTAYPAAIVWLSGRLSAGASWRRGVLAAAAATHLALGGAVAASSISPAVAERLGLANALEDSRAWRRTAALIASRAEGQPYTAIVTDHRALFFELSYYWRREGRSLPPLRMWVLREAPGNHAEAVAPMTADLGARVLVVHLQDRYVDLVRGDFERYRASPQIDLELGGGERRGVILAEASGFRPAPRNAAFLAALD